MVGPVFCYICPTFVFKKDIDYSKVVLLIWETDILKQAVSIARIPEDVTGECLSIHQGAHMKAHAQSGFTERGCSRAFCEDLQIPCRPSCASLPFQIGDMSLQLAILAGQIQLTIANFRAFNL